MDKLILLSIVVITIVVPAATAAEGNPRRAFQRMFAGMLIGIVAYVVSVLFIYPRVHS
jgi:hypothetical protein